MDQIITTFPSSFVPLSCRGKMTMPVWLSGITRGFPGHRKTWKQTVRSQDRTKVKIELRREVDNLLGHDPIIFDEPDVNYRDEETYTYDEPLLNFGTTTLLEQDGYLSMSLLKVGHYYGFVVYNYDRETTIDFWGTKHEVFDYLVYSYDVVTEPEFRRSLKEACTLLWACMPH